MTKIYSFGDIFCSTFIDESGENIELNEIVIPIIQRDYAQGRKDPEIRRVRIRFLDALYDAIVNKPITLDFIYGDINKNGTMFPLDGQQRLTTLFLLYWYAAKKEKINSEEYSFLYKFRYKTRYSARDFCERLVNFSPKFTKKTISEEIINENWFPFDWQKDPTISSMLVMLDDIRTKFSNINNIWEKLKNSAITFYFLPIKDMGLTDELYIKMNSRGKPLTQFENFKAELEHELNKIEGINSLDIIRKIDKEWTDMLWPYKDEYNTVDTPFLHYFRFICDIICYKHGDTPLGKNLDEIDLIKEYFSNTSDDVINNVKLLEGYFDCWCNINQTMGIDKFFDHFIAYSHEDGKILFDRRYYINLFKECLENYGILIDNTKRRQFPLGRLIILYAFINYGLNMDKIDERDFRRRIRIINNLVNNSEFEMSNSDTRQGGNRIPAILKQVDSIMFNGRINYNLDINFNLRQLNEEMEKLIWTEQNRNKMDALFKLEDHELLFGQISVVGLENDRLFEAFHKLFTCDLDKINMAMLTIGDYSQPDKWRTQLGSSEKSAFIRLFHPTKFADNTKNVLCELLMLNTNPNNYYLDNLIHNYLYECECKNLYDWRYYYIKYSEFRPGRYGKYSWKNFDEKPYEMNVMWTNTNISEYSYQPFLKAVDKRNNLSREHFGQRILDGDKYIISTNNSYIIYSSNNNIQLEKIEINQNEDGIDTEDRIKKFLSIYYK